MISHALTFTAGLLTGAVTGIAFYHWLTGLIAKATEGISDFDGDYDG